jgi:hypothetical protein
MNVSKDMETKFIALLSGLILDKYDDTPLRFVEQEKALKGLRCSNQRLGRWIEKWDFPFLIETLLLDDTVFSQEFPDIQITAEERKELANALEEHSENCSRCHLKRSYDLEWQARVNKAFSENRQVIGEAITHARNGNKRD